MAKSINEIGKMRRRVATGQDPLVGARLPLELVSFVDVWAADFSPHMTRAEAIRCLVELGLKARIGRRSLQQRILGFLKEGMGNSERVIAQYERGIARFHIGKDDKTAEVLQQERARVVKIKQLIAEWSRSA